MLKYSWALLFVLFLFGCESPNPSPETYRTSKLSLPDTAQIPNNKTGEEIRYGYRLFSQTASLLGTEGTVMQLCGNKMNCMHCHLDVGMRENSNSLLETYLKYPQYRAREGMVLTIEDRINNCFERPMNGKMLPYDSREMRAMVAYMRWLCEGRTVSFSDDSLHLGKITLLERAANVDSGALVYASKCLVCHGADGQGKMAVDSSCFEYPPLWGENSYAQGSSMHRVITAARFIKWSMPYVAKPSAPQLTDAEAFDVAAFINCDSIHSRPYRPLKRDCPDLANKPIDFPSGPFLDSFPVTQHILGPYQPIKKFYETLNRN